MKGVVYISLIRLSKTMQRSGSHGNAVKSAFLIMIMIIMTQVGYLDMINSPTTGNDSFDEESSVMETGSSGSSQSNFTSSAEGADLTVGQAMANITFQYNTSAASGSGSGSGTVMVKDINSGSANGAPSGLTAVGNTLFFRADDGTNGNELWKSDGTASGTVMVKDIYSGISSSSPHHLTTFGNTLYFAANDGTNGVELWKSDGTASGTVMVQAVGSGSGSSPSSLVVVGNTLYFGASDGINGRELWALDPANITGLSSGASGMTDVTGATCSVSPSLPAGLNIDSSTCTISGTPTVETTNRTYTITAVISGTTYQTTVWLSAVTYGTITSTVDGAHLELGEAMTQITLNYTSQAPQSSVSSGNNTTWAINNAESTNLNSGGRFIELGNQLLYTVRYNDGTADTWEIRPGGASGSSTSDYYKVIPGKFLSMATVFNNEIYFQHNDELWKTAGTNSSTVKVHDVNPFTKTGDQHHQWELFFEFNNELYFQGYVQENGTELWKTDGTTQGTMMIKDIANTTYTNLGQIHGHDGMAEYYDPAYQIFNGELTFVARERITQSSGAVVNIASIWATDGTESGTYKLVDGNSSTNGGVSISSTTTQFNGDLYYVASNASLMKFDGNTGVTSWIIDDVYIMNYHQLTFFEWNGYLYFNGASNNHGPELWRTDGTPSGTALVANFVSDSSSMNILFTGLGNIQFKAWNETHFAFDGRVLAQQSKGEYLYISDGTLANTSMHDHGYRYVYGDYQRSFMSTNSVRGAGHDIVHIGQITYYTKYASHGTPFCMVNLGQINPSQNNSLTETCFPGYSSGQYQGDYGFGAAHVYDDELYLVANRLDPAPSTWKVWSYAPDNVTLSTPPPVTWDTHPDLPAGMNLAGGIISGTPSVYAVNQTYTIYANQSNYSTTLELYFSVDTDNAHTVVENQTIDAIGFHGPFQNGTTNWNVSPALPADLVMDPNTGEITGSVNGVLANTTYTVTATHGGSGTGATETFTFSLQSLADYDGDGLANELPADYNAAQGPTSGLVADTDDDGDGLADSVETDTGTYIDGTNTGTDPLNPDTDGDGICDGPNAVPPICIAGPDADPNGDSVPPTLVGVNNTAIATVAPYKTVIDGTYEIAPDLPATLSLHPTTGEITGTPTETITNTTFTMWANNSNGDSVSWNFTVEILEDSDGDGMPNELPDDYDAGNPDAPGLIEDTDDDGDGTPDIEEDGDGTDSTNPDTDGDGMCDGPNAVDPICVAGPDAFPLDPSGDTDTDGDGKPDTLNPPSNSIPPLEEDLDDDGDGLEDVNETNTGIDNGPTDKGTDPLNPDTDGDGICDGPIDVYDPLGNLICVAGPDETPFGEDASGMVYGLNNTPFSSLVPPYQLPNAVWEIAPDLPLGLSIDPVSGIISGTPAEIMENTTFTIYGNATSSSITFDFNLQILEDTDRDGMPNTLPEDYPVDGELIEDLDDDGDGASDLSETGTGIYNGTGDMGTDPLDPDTDDDGICDGPNDVLPQCIGGPDSNPFGTGPLGPTVLVNNSMTAPILPANAVPGATWEVSPALPDGLVLDPATGIITGTPTQTMANTTFTMWANTTTPSMSILSTFWLEVLEDSDGDGMPDELPDDYPDTNPPYDLIEDLDDDNDGMSDEDETILGTDPTNPDTDGDGFCDGNGTGDGDCYAGPDSSPLDPTQPVNTDGDAYPDEDPDGEGGLTADDDDDNDGYLDTREIDCLSDPLNATDMPQDLDMDGICDALDDDIDGDGLFNVIETNTGIYNSSIDTGSDPRNADTDGDGVCDGPTSPVTSNCTAGPDAFPLDPAAHADTDGDGMPDELFGNSTSTPPLVLDLDDDNDDWSDEDETACGTDHLDDTSTPVDTDEDGICDALDDLLDLPFTLTYSSETLLLNVDEEMTAFMPNISGLGEVATWEISGELPEGLTFGWSPARDVLLDGSIRGTPTEEMEMTNFTIWANNSAHSQSFDFSLTIVEEVVDEDDDDDGFGWMWCFPCLIILLLLLLIPLLFGSDKILLMLADGPEPENTTSSPAFLSGAGTQENPFVLEPITGIQPGESASSVEVITIDKMSDIQVEMIDLNQDSNGDKFCMYEPEFGDTGTRLIGIGKDGEIIIHMKFDDGIDTPTFEGGEYSGLLKLGRASVYFSWSVTVKKNMSKKKKYEKELAKELEESNDAEESDSEGDEPEGAVDVVKEKIHTTLDRDGDGELSLEDVKAGASQVGESVKKGAETVSYTHLTLPTKA